MLKGNVTGMSTDECVKRSKSVGTKMNVHLREGITEKVICAHSMVYDTCQGRCCF